MDLILSVLRTCSVLVACCCSASTIRAAEALDDAVEHTFYISNAQMLAFRDDGKLLAAAGGRNGSHGKIKALKNDGSVVAWGVGGVSLFGVHDDGRAFPCLGRWLSFALVAKPGFCQRQLLCPLKRTKRFRAGIF